MNISDSLNNLREPEVAQVAMSVLNVIQMKDKGTQVAGIATPFLLLCKVFDASPREVLEKAERVMRDADYNTSANFKGIEDYIRGELM